MGNKPVNYVSWYDSARFANWMNNGQGSGSTENGAHTLIGNTGMPTRNMNSTVWLPSENEWYKAAYFDPTKEGTGAYWFYPTRGDSTPTVATASIIGDISNPGTNEANYDFGADWNGRDGIVTTAGGTGSGSASHYGTFDQGGNVWEWNEAVIFGLSRGARGGSWAIDVAPQSTARGDFIPTVEDGGFFGFRLATVPEPSSVVLAGLAGMAFLARRRRPSFCPFSPSPLLPFTTFQGPGKRVKSLRFFRGNHQPPDDCTRPGTMRRT